VVVVEVLVLVVVMVCDGGGGSGGSGGVVVVCTVEKPQVQVNPTNPMRLSQAATCSLAR
jgi:hypothetical protein